MFWKIISSLAACAILAVCAILLLLPRLDLAGPAASRATALFGRKVSIASLHVRPGRWLAVSLDGAGLANRPGFSPPDMATLHHATVEIEALALLRGRLTLRHLHVDGLAIALEHRPDGAKNWQGGLERARPAAPADRSRDPTVLDAEIRSFSLVYRGPAGATLTTALDRIALSTPAASAPVTLAAAGTYNKAPVSLTASLASFDALRDAAHPYAADIRLATRDTRARFQGTLTDPLNADGAQGTASLQAPEPSQLLELAGIASTSIPPIALAGPFVHKGDHWSFTGAAGTLASMGFTARTLALDEGSGGKPDRIAADIAFDRLDLGFLDIPAPSRKPTPADISLSVDRNPGVLIEAKLAATRLAYGGVALENAKLDASLTPGRIALHALSIAYLGATGTAAATIDAAGDGGRVTLDADLAGIDLQQVARSAGFGQMRLSGRLSGHLSASAAGRTMREAAAAKTAAIVLTMTSGTIPRALIEKASTDIRTLFRRAAGSAPIACALAVATIKGNEGHLSPLRIRAGSATIGGAGTFDLARRTLDIVVGSQAATTSAFALDIPMRLSGPLQNPLIAPARLTEAGRTLLDKAGTIPPLPATLAAAARANPCATR